MYTNICIFIHVYTCMYTYIYTYIQTYIYTYMYIYVYILVGRKVRRYGVRSWERIVDPFGTEKNKKLQQKISKKQQSELIECKFTPHINNISRAIVEQKPSNSLFIDEIPAHERLYTEHKQRFYYILLLCDFLIICLFDLFYYLFYLFYLFIYYHYYFYYYYYDYYYYYYFYYYYI